MSAKKKIAGVAFCMASVYAVVALYIPVQEAVKLSSNSDYSFWWYARQNAGAFGLVAFALLIALLSFVYIRKGNGHSSLLKDIWLGLLTGGSASFILPFVMIAKGLITGDASDGVYWWIMWYLSVFFTALPLVIIGVILSTTVGWVQRRKR